MTDRFFAVKGMAAFLKEHADQLVRSKSEDIDVIEKKDDKVRVAVRTADDGSQFVFVRTDDANGPHSGTIRYLPSGNDHLAALTIIHYNLPPTGSLICFLPKNVTDDSLGGKWYPQPAGAPDRPEKLPNPVEVTSVKRKYDSFPDDSAYKPYPTGSGEEDLGVFDRRNTVYRTRVNLDSYTEGGTTGVVLSVRVTGRDDASAFLNGKRATVESHEGGIENFKFAEVKQGDNDVAILYENAARPNNGNGMEARSGLRGAWFASSAAVGVPIQNWQTKIIPNADDHSLIGENVDAKGWKKTSVINDDGDMAEHQTVVYRATIEVAANDIAGGRQLVFGRIDELGWIFVNGQLVAKSTDWSEPMRCDVTAKLKPGKNVIAVIVQNDQGVGGIARGVSLQPSGDAKAKSSPALWQFAPGTAGMLANWSKEDVDDSQWETVQINGMPGKAKRRQHTRLVSRVIRTPRGRSAPVHSLQSAPQHYRQRISISQRPSPRSILECRSTDRFLSPRLLAQIRAGAEKCRYDDRAWIGLARTSIDDDYAIRRSGGSAKISAIFFRPVGGWPCESLIFPVRRLVCSVLSPSEERCVYRRCSRGLWFYFALCFPLLSRTLVK